LKPFRARSGVLGGTVAIAIGVAVAAAFTISDWKLNPAGIFQDEAGTHWDIVLETAMSWFLPVVLIVLPLATALHYWLAPPRDR